MEAGEGFYRRLFELAPEAYVVTDATGTICELNRAARRVLEDATRPVTGLSIFQLVAENDREEFERAVTCLVRTDWPTSPVELIVHLGPIDARPVVARVTISALGPILEGSATLGWIIRPTNVRSLGPRVARLHGVASAGTSDVARRVDDGLGPVVGAVGLSLRHPRLPAELKLALAEAAVALDGAVQWMGQLERAVEE